MSHKHLYTSRYENGEYTESCKICWFKRPGRNHYDKNQPLEDFIDLTIDKVYHNLRWLEAQRDDYAEYLRTLISEGYTVHTWGDGSKAIGGIILTIAKRPLTGTWAESIKSGAEYKVVNTERNVDFYGEYSA